MELKHWSGQKTRNGKALLIVPYGIETSDRRPALPNCTILLIVPYGIETELTTVKEITGTCTFNCTLWN